MSSDLFAVGDIVRPRYRDNHRPVTYEDVLSAYPCISRTITGSPTMRVIDISQQFGFDNVFVEWAGHPGTRWLFKSWDLALVEGDSMVEVEQPKKWPEFPIGSYVRVKDGTRHVDSMDRSWSILSSQDYHYRVEGAFRPADGTEPSITILLDGGRVAQAFPVSAFEPAPGVFIDPHVLAHGALVRVAERPFGHGDNVVALRGGCYGIKVETGERDGWAAPVGLTYFVSAEDDFGFELEHPSTRTHGRFSWADATDFEKVLPGDVVLVDPHKKGEIAKAAMGIRARVDAAVSHGSMIDVEALREHAKATGATLPVGLADPAPVNDWSTGFDEYYDDHRPRNRKL